MRDEAYETYELNHAGMKFRVEYRYDGDLGPPWEHHDGHGVVSEWTSRDKRPGERVLSEDHGSRRYYDIAESIKIAKRDSWGPAVEGQTKNQIAAAAVEKDFEYLRGWCADEWHWTWILVTLLDENGGETEETESLCGMESDQDDYLKETAVDLAGQIVRRIEHEAAEAAACERMMVL